MIASFVHEYDADTRILVKYDTEDDSAPVQLFNADDLMPLPNPVEGSALRIALLNALVIHSFEHEQKPAVKAVIQ